MKPDVVLYEEGLDEETIRGAVEAIASADMLLIGGTSHRSLSGSRIYRLFQRKPSCGDQ